MDEVVTAEVERFLAPLSELPAVLLLLLLPAKLTLLLFLELPRLLRLVRDADVDGRGMRLVVAGRDEVTLYKRVSATNSESAVAVGVVAMSCSFMILYISLIEIFSCF